jgi:WD40 repeat protein
MRAVPPRLRSWSRRGFLTLAAAVSLSALPAISQPQPKLNLKVTETSLGKIPPGADTRNAEISSDSRHIAYPAKHENGYAVFVDGLPGAVYEWVTPRGLAFSPDNQRVAYGIQRGDRFHVVFDKQEGPAYREVAPPVFSKDGKRLAYAATLLSEDKKMVAVIDGNQSKPYDKIRAFRFSPDSTRVAFGAENAGKQFWVIDGKEEKAYDSIGPVVFSDDSKHHGYNAQLGLKQRAVIDGVEAKEYSRAGNLEFSKDGRFAYAATDGKQFFVVFDGKELAPYDMVGTPFFSADGKRLGYLAGRARRQFLVIDGEEQRAFDQVVAGKFSEDGKRLAYIGVEGRKFMVVNDGEIGKEYKLIASLLISPDGSTVAYGAKEGTNEGDREFLVLNGREIPGGMHATMSPDGKHVAHAEPKVRTSVLKINDTVGPEYDSLPSASKWTFTGSNKLTLIAVKNREVFRVEVEW